MEGFFLLKGKKKRRIFPHVHTLQEFEWWEHFFLHRCSDGEGAAPVDNWGKLLALLSEIA